MEQAGDKDASLKNETGDAVDDSIHAKTTKTKAKHRDNKELEDPWPDPYADHRGPIQDSRHIQDAINNLTRHPEVAIIKDMCSGGRSRARPASRSGKRELRLSSRP